MGLSKNLPLAFEELIIVALPLKKWGRRKNGYNGE